MTQRNDSLDIANNSTKLAEHYCQYKILLRECAELLAELHSDFGELRYSVYQDDEIHDDDCDREFRERLQMTWDGGLEMIERLEALKILESPRKPNSLFS